MNTYYVHYHYQGGTPWIVFCIKDTSMGCVCEWVKRTLKPNGYCVSLIYGD